MPRLFTGLEVPDDVAGDLALIRGGVSGARWIEPEDYHITLGFIGDVDSATARDLTEELSSVRVKRFTLIVEGLGAFGGNKPRSIIANVRLGDTLQRLHEEQERALRCVGVTIERRKYTPHITLARLKNVPVNVVAEFLASRTPKAMSFEATRFVLYSARASVGGGPYLVEAAYSFD